MSMQKKIVILVTAVVAAIAFTIIGITSKNVKLKYEELPEGSCPCGYVYDSAKGDLAGGIPAGTEWKDVPDTWVCPTCGIAKDAYAGTYAVSEYYSKAITSASAKIDAEYKGVAVTQIANNAFASGSLESIEIPDSITYIGKSAFKNCTSLAEITIPAGVTVIGEGAFELCTSLKEVELPKNIKVISTNMFYGCENLESIVIPEGVTKICTSAFDSCSNLKSVTLPESITTIKTERS